MKIIQSICLNKDKFFLQKLIKNNFIHTNIHKEKIVLKKNKISSFHKTYK